MGVFKEFLYPLTPLVNPPTTQVSIVVMMCNDARPYTTILLSLFLSKAALPSQSWEGHTSYQPSQELEATHVTVPILWHEDTVSPQRSQVNGTLAQGLGKGSQPLTLNNLTSNCTFKTGLNIFHPSRDHSPESNSS